MFTQHQSWRIHIQVEYFSRGEGEREKGRRSRASIQVSKKVSYVVCWLVSQYTNTNGLDRASITH